MLSVACVLGRRPLEVMRRTADGVLTKLSGCERPDAEHGGALTFRVQGPSPHVLLPAYT
jgi:hypothetical protein